MANNKDYSKLKSPGASPYELKSPIASPYDLKSANASPYLHRRLNVGRLRRSTKDPSTRAFLDLFDFM